MLTVNFRVDYYCGLFFWKNDRIALGFLLIPERTSSGVLQLQLLFEKPRKIEEEVRVEKGFGLPKNQLYSTKTNLFV